MKILALGNEPLTKRVSELLTARGFQVTCLNDIPKDRHKNDYAAAVVDGRLKNAEEICFRLIWLFRIRVILVADDGISVSHNLRNTGIDSFLTVRDLPARLSGEVDRVISLGGLRFKNMKCLLIEDDPSIRETVKLVFEYYWPEAEVLETDKGFEGAIIAGNQPVDIILLDLGLPDIHGFDVLTWLHGFCNTPVIIVTANNNRENVVKALGMRADDYVVKPFASRDLILRVKKVLDNADKGNRFTVEISTRM